MSKIKFEIDEERFKRAKDMFDTNPRELQMSLESIIQHEISILKKDIYDKHQVDFDITFYLTNINLRRMY